MYILKKITQFFEIIEFIIYFCKLNEKDAKKLLSYMTYDYSDFLLYNTANNKIVPIDNLSQLLKIKQILVKMYKITNPTCKFLKYKIDYFPDYLKKNIGKDLFILNDITITCMQTLKISNSKKIKEIISSLVFPYYNGLLNLGFNNIQANYLEKYGDCIKMYFLSVILFNK